MIGDMPRDSLAFAVGVAGEIYVVLTLGSGLDFAQDLLFALDRDEIGRKIVLDIDAELAFGQVDDVADRGHDLVVATEIALYGFRLCGRFDDYEIFCHRSGASKFPYPTQVSRQCKSPTLQGLHPARVMQARKACRDAE